MRIADMVHKGKGPRASPRDARTRTHRRSACDRTPPGMDIIRAASTVVRVFRNPLAKGRVMRIAGVVTRANVRELAGAIRARGLAGALHVIVPRRAWILSALQVLLSAFFVILSRKAVS